MSKKSFNAALSDIKATYKNLTDDIEEFVKEISNIGAQAIVFEMPPVLDTQEKELMNIGRVGVPVNRYDDFLGISKALAAYSDFKARPKQSTKYAHKIPGVIILAKGEHSHILNLLERIQRHKDSIKKVVGDFSKEPREKHDLLHTAVPAVISYQLYREIPVIQNKVSSMSFAWVNKSVAPVMNQDEVITMLLNSRPEKNGELMADDWELKIANLIDAVKSSPYTLFKKPKHHNRVPCVTYSIEVEGGKKKQKPNVPCTVPMLLLNNTEDDHTIIRKDLGVPDCAIKKSKNEGWHVVLDGNPLLGKIG